MAKGLRAGVAGAGFGTRVIVPALRAEGWEVPALWSRREEMVQKRAAKMEIPFATTDYQAFLERDDLDLVVIVTPTSTHRDMYIEALRSGKHVLCEKPFAMNAQEAEEVVAAAAETSATVMINFESRFMPQRLHVERLVKDGYVGEVRHASVEMWWDQGFSEQDRTWRSQASMGGGALNEQGSHHLDQFRQWFGEAEWAQAHLAAYEPGRRDSDADTDDYFTATLGLESGAVATITMSWTAGPSQGSRLTVAGSEGTLTAYCPYPLFMQGEVRGARRGDASLEPLDLPDDLEPLAIERLDQGMIESQRRLLRAFERGMGDGSSPVPNLEDGLQVQRMLDAIRDSAAQGRRVSL